MPIKINIAVVGATGAVGEQMIRALEERNFPADNLYPLASEKSAGKKIRFCGDEVTVGNLAEFNFAKTPLALFSAGGDVSKQYAPGAAAAGCAVVDNSSHFRYDDDIPLVVCEVNPGALADYKNRNIIANPNCSTMQLLVALKPIHDAAKITRINVATYQAVSGAGNAAVRELAEQSAAMLSGLGRDGEVFPVQIAFNAIPHIDAFLENGYTREEMKMVWETQKILNDKTILVNPTAVRIPVFYGHGEAVHLETKNKIGAAAARKLLSESPGVCVIDEHTDGGYPTATTHAAGRDEVFVGRIREDISRDNGLNLWIVSDNTRKGAATNAVQIAEILLAKYL